MSQFGAGSNSAVNHLRATTNQWYHPYISRADGAQLLEGCEAGSFILRESSKGGSYALSVVLPSTGALGHYLVEKRGPECFCLQGSENSFCAIEDLLAHYHHHDSIGLPCRLRLPQRHSSSMSYTSRPTLPALPPRNNSRAGSVSRPSPTRPHPKMNPNGSGMGPAPVPSTSPSGMSGKGMIKPHLDVGRPYGYGGNDMEPVGGYQHQSRQTLPSPHGSRAAATSAIPTSPHPAADEMEGETYEDMAVGGLGSMHQSHPMHPGPPDGLVHPDEMEGETYEDMASSGLSSLHQSHSIPAEEEGETYEDMSVTSGRPGSSSRMPPTSPRHPTPAEPEEFGETYEDMSSSSLRPGHPAAGHAPPAEPEEGEMYEDMSSVSSGLRPR